MTELKLIFPFALHWFPEQAKLRNKMKMENAIRVFPEQSICMLFSSFRRRRQRILGNSEEAASLIGEAIETQTITLYLTLV